MNGTTTIKISKKTLEKIKKLGKMGETYEDVIERLIKLQGENEKDINLMKGGKEQ